MRDEVEAYVVAPELDEHEPGPGWILVLPDEMPEDLQKTPGGLYIGRDPGAPSVAPIRTGKVVAIGPPQDSQAPRNVEVGEWATFSDVNAIKINLKGVEHLQVTYAQFLGRSVPSEKPMDVPSSQDQILLPSPDLGLNGNGGYPRPVR